MTRVLEARTRARVAMAQSLNAVAVKVPPFSSRLFDELYARDPHWCALVYPCSPQQMGLLHPTKRARAEAAQSLHADAVKVPSLVRFPHWYAAVSLANCLVGSCLQGFCTGVLPEWIRVAPPESITRIDKRCARPSGVMPSVCSSPFNPFNSVHLPFNPLRTVRQWCPFTAPFNPFTAVHPSIRSIQFTYRSMIELQSVVVQCGVVPLHCATLPGTGRASRLRDAHQLCGALRRATAAVQPALTGRAKLLPRAELLRHRCRQAQLVAQDAGLAARAPPLAPRAYTCRIPVLFGTVDHRLDDR